MRVRFTFFVFSFLLWIYTCEGQNTLPTEKTVTIRVGKATPVQFLQIIAQQAQIKFSYNPQIFADFPTIALTLENVSVREALHHAFGNAIKLKTKSNYIILQKSNLPMQSQQAENRPLKVTLSGYVIDKNSQKRIEQVSVYEKNTLSAVLTDINGFFQITVETPKSEIKLFFAKSQYYPQSLDLPSQNTPFVNVQLEPMPDLKPLQPHDLKKTSTPSPTQYMALVPKIQVIHAQNVKESFWRKAQFSLLPMLGTNHVLSGLVRNKISFNALVGYNAGVSQFELGGFANINRGSVEKVQIGGFFNAVAGSVKGVQLGGFFNLVRDSVMGLQVGGFFNINGKKIRGVQIGGIFNVNADSLEGVQVGGLMNVGLRGVRGIQVGGLLNINSHQTSGVQIAGLLNVAWGRVEGVQVAGILNVAGKARNTWQVGLFNYADSAQNLKQIGLINIARRGGYKNIELSTNEMLFTDFTIRSGTPYFYTLARIGIRYFPNRPFWHYGYGFGIRVAQWRTWECNTEVLAYQLVRSLGRAYNVRVFENFGGRYQLYFSKYVGKHLAFSLAGAIDFSALHIQGADYEQARTLSNSIFYNITSRNRDFRWSSGLTFGVRWRW